MSGSVRWDRVFELFEAALERPAVERSAWLAGQVGDDPSLQAEVEAMLSAHEREEGILELPIRPGPHGREIADALGEALGDRFRIVRELGRGGMAIVFLAWERKHDRPVVLKVLRPEIAARYGAERFEREVRLAARLSHPHIVGLIDSGEAAGLLYYVMPHVEGETLRERLAREGSLPRDEALPLLRDVAGALAHAHEAGVVHRDLKPDNVLVAGRHAYLMDFGVAKSVTADAEEANLTRTGDAVGTPRYMAPEQLAGMAALDHRADLYAWGQLAHEMFAGSVREMQSSDLDGREVAPEVAARLSARRPDLPAELAELVGRCLEVRPSRRLDSAREILAVIERAGALTPAGRSVARDVSGVGPARAPGRGRRTGGRGRHAVLVGAGLLVAAATAGLAFALLRGTPERAAPVAVASDVALSGPVAVAPLANETGDASLDVLGRLAGDWITEGLLQTNAVPVVPWPTALRAAEIAAAAADAGRPVDPVSFLAAETGAATIVTGSFYRVGEKLRFRAEVTDARNGRLISALAAEAAPAGAPVPAIQALRDRLMGSLAVATDERLASAPGIARHPPTFDAYRAFDAGMRLYLQQEYEDAAPEFFRAFSLDTTFTEALLLAATNLYNLGTRPGKARADSVLGELGAKRGTFSELQELRWRHLTAMLDSDAETALRAVRRAREIAPASRTSYNVAETALNVMRPAEARRVLESLDPDRGAMREWAQYWTALAHARHLTGDHEGELAAARAMRSRHPDRTIARVLEARALAASGRTGELETALAEMETLPPTTYWSLGAALTVAGEELRAHGRPREGDAMLERAGAWLEARLSETPGRREHRYWLGSALYDLGRWREAAAVFGGLAVDYPDRETYAGLAALSEARLGDLASARARLAASFPYAEGERTAYLARVEAIAGDPARGLSLLIDALRMGAPGAPWLHASAWPDLLLMRDDPRLEATLAGDAR
ncbi:MAG: protein kinase [Gemmatimonadota bacterium]